MITPLLTHTCTLRTRHRKQRLDYAQGTSSFAIGDTITGAASRATARVDEIVVASGSWAGGDAAGYMVLSNVVGVFQVGELVTSDTGAAHATGMGDYQTLGGEYEYYYVDSGEVPCRFATAPSVLVVSEAGAVVRRPTRVYLLPATVCEGDTLTTSINGYAGAYRVRGVVPVYGPDGVHHLELDVEAVP